MNFTGECLFEKLNYIENDLGISLRDYIEKYLYGKKARGLPFTSYEAIAHIFMMEEVSKHEVLNQVIVLRVIEDAMNTFKSFLREKGEWGACL